MLRTDRDALVCDLAETYGIFRMKDYPVELISTLSAGLRDDSRIIQKIEKRTFSNRDVLLSFIYDKLNLLFWAQTEDGVQGIHMPAPLLSQVEREGFDSPEDFEKARKDILGGV